MQQIGQAPFSVVSLSVHSTTNVLLVQQFVKHGQKSLALPS
jgi:hypothetical protein